MSTFEFKVEHLHKKYGFNKFYTLKDVSLTINSGTIVGFLGPNGAGKSTFIKSVTGILTYSKGAITLDGIELDKKSEIFKKNLGFVPDQYILYEKSTGYDFLYSIGKIYGVSKTDLVERIKYYSKRLDIENNINRKISSYSHGMKQKIGIIASLLHEPKLWILDEPLTGLDPLSINQVKQMMIEYAKKGNIVFFSSHLIDVVKNLCTDIVIIVNGKICAKATIKEINKRKITLEKYYLNIVNAAK